MNPLQNALKLNRPIRMNNLVVLMLLLAAMICFFHFQSPYFLTKLNLLNIMSQISEIGFMAIPLTFLIISGVVDISIGSILGLSAMIMGLAYQAGIPIWPSIMLALLTGLACGALNGVLIANLRMQGIVVTIGTLVMFRGIVYVVSEGRPIGGYPDAFFYLGQGKILGIPFNVFVLLLLFAIGYLIIRKTPFSRYIYALGNNEEAVRYSGINVIKVRFYTLLANGGLAALAGVFLISRLGSAEATSGENIEMDVITAVLIGGTHIFGGRGSLIGTFLGLLIIGVLRNGLNLMGVSVLYQTMILGILILIAVGKQKQ